MNQNRGNDRRKAAERICHDVQKHTMQVLVVVVATVAVRMAVVFIVVGATVAVVIAAVAVVIVGVAVTVIMAVPVIVSEGTLAVAVRTSEDATVGMVMKRKQTDHIDDKAPARSADQIVLVHFRGVNKPLHRLHHD